MKKVILALAVAAVAALSVASLASAATPSYPTPVPFTSTHQLTLVTHYNGADYTHHYTITENLLGGFTGVAAPGDIVPGETVQGVLSPFGLAISGAYPSSYASDPGYTWQFVGSYHAGGAVLYQHDSHDLKWTVDVTVS